MWDVCNTTAKIVVTSETQTATEHQLTGPRRRVVGKLCPIPWKMCLYSILLAALHT
jgi:hypothetical protein